MPEKQNLDNIYKEIENTQILLKKDKNKKKINKIARMIISSFLWVISFVLLILCINNLYQQLLSKNNIGLFGFGQAVVASNSMDAKDSDQRIKQNDLVFYKQIDLSNVQVGDVIIYEKVYSNNDKTLIIHRLVEINDSTFIAKGDNNSLPDEEMSIDALKGQYVLKINKLGIIFNALRNPIYLVLIVIFLIVISVIRVWLYNKNRKKLIANITEKEGNREAISHFFDL